MIRAIFYLLLGAIFTGLYLLAHDNPPAPPGAHIGEKAHEPR